MEDNPYSDLPFGIWEKIDASVVKTMHVLDNPYCDLPYYFSLSILWRDNSNPYGFGNALSDEQAFASAMLDLEYGFPEAVRLFRLYGKMIPRVKL